MNLVMSILSTVGGDALNYFTKNNGINSTTGVTIVGAPELIKVIEQMSAGTDMSAALAAGGYSAYLALAWYGLRFAVYLLNKAKK